MDCSRYSNLMSQKLDGELSELEAEHFETHVAGCTACTALWAAMMEADVLVWKWVSEPLPMPDNFGAKVMQKIAAQADAQRAPSFEWTPAAANVTRPLTEVPSIPGPLTARIQNWQSRANRYVRGVAIAAFSVAAAFGLTLTLLLTGVIQLEGPLAATVRSYLNAIDTWARSLFVGFGAGVYAAVGLVMLLLALVGWQLVAQYQRSAQEPRGNTGMLEALT
jgi:anti-sigma factor RsiW